MKYTLLTVAYIVVVVVPLTKFAAGVGLASAHKEHCKTYCCGCGIGDSISFTDFTEAKAEVEESDWCCDMCDRTAHDNAKEESHRSRCW